MWPVLG